MAFDIVKSLGNGGGFLNDKLPRIIEELQGLTLSFVAGAASGPMLDANNPSLQDTVVKALSQDDTSGVLTDRTTTTSFIDVRATGSLSMVTGLAAGDIVSVRGIAYTARNVTPTDTSSGLGAREFSNGKQAGVSTILTKGQLMSLGFTPAEASTLVTNANVLYVAAASLAKAVNAEDSKNVTASATLGSVVCTITAKDESTSGNSIALAISQSNAHATRSGATLSGGLFGSANGTVTLASALENDTVTVNSLVYTGKDAPSGNTQFLTGGTDTAGATSLAVSINARDGAAVTATSALGVVSLRSVSDSPAGAAITLTSSNGTRAAVTGSGTLTAPSKGWLSSVSLSGAHLLVVWFKKSRLVGQA